MPSPPAIIISPAHGQPAAVRSSLRLGGGGLYEVGGQERASGRGSGEMMKRCSLTHSVRAPFVLRSCSARAPLVSSSCVELVKTVPSSAHPMPFVSSLVSFFVSWGVSFYPVPSPACFLVSRLVPRLVPRLVSRLVSRLVLGVVSLRLVMSSCRLACRLVRASRGVLFVAAGRRLFGLAVSSGCRAHCHLSYRYRLVIIIIGLGGA